MHISCAGTQRALLNDRRRPTHEDALEKLFADIKVCKVNVYDAKHPVKVCNIPWDAHGIGLLSDSIGMQTCHAVKAVFLDERCQW